MMEKAGLELRPSSNKRGNASAGHYSASPEVNDCQNRWSILFAPSGRARDPCLQVAWRLTGC
jgi:hypothetical protein